MSAVLLYAALAAGGAVVGFGIGWLVRGIGRDHRLQAAERASRAEVEALESELALARLRDQSRIQARLAENGDSAPVIEFPSKLAQRPARPSDSSTARA